ncbi:efflux transporter outer membrane subunit [Rhodopseudomonas palustris]|uniref:efflux transporter outer membrane subunit n=1 Tax=Rhodopseudomonas palustris TaxID=1076 RepID=UPI000D19F5CA|nr:efflux transporter outer membrane subunit [Rhodopseudomonas palustris]AVT80924.1 ABC-type export system, outer membrane channel protein [Rhodopseudomonas palustris]
MLRWLGALGTCVCLAGCAVGPNFVQPQSPEVDRYTAAALPAKSPGKAQPFVVAEDVPTRWWSAFRSDPLDRLVRATVVRNPSLQAADAAIKVAHFNALAQRGLFFPQVSASYSPSTQLSSNNEASDAPQQRLSLHTAQLNIAYTFDVWGGNARAVESLDAVTEQQQFLLEATHLTLTANVVTAAIGEASLRGQIAATKKIVAIERDILGILKSQFEAGQAAQVDVLTQEAALAQVEQTLPPLEKQLAIQRDLLTALAGNYSAAQVPERFELARLSLPRNIPVLVPSTLVRRRPDVRAAEANLHAVSAQVGVAVAARLPNISVGASTAGASATNFAQLFAPGTGFYLLAANATQPIIDGMTLLHKQRAAEAALEQADAQYRQAVISALQNVADALQSLQHDAALVRAAAKSEAAAKASLDIIRKQLALGQVNQVVVLNAQQTYLNASIAHVQAEATRLSDAAALFMAIGGSWPAGCGADWRSCVLDDLPVTAALQ